MEILVENSRFIATLAPVFSVDEARAFISRIRMEFADASHHVPAFIIGHGSSEIAHCSDAGEPSGTAGRPALAVLRGSGLGDACVVVTRYFGGTKLGTGGLVHAYSEAVRQVLSKVHQAHKRMVHTIMLAFHYRYLERVRSLVSKHHGRILDESFAADVTLTARFPVDDLAGFREAIQELSNGAWDTELIETGEILVLDEK